MVPALPKAVVVAGGAGFLGKRVVRRWLEQLGKEAGEDRPRVVSLDRRPNPEAEASVVADLSDPDSVERLLFREFAVQSIVAVATPPLVGPSYQDFIEVNVAALFDLARMAERHGVRRFVYTSSIAASDHWTAHTNASEADPSVTPHLSQLRSPYDLSKALAEDFVARQHSPGGMRTVSIRLAGLYGGAGDPYFHRRLPFGLSADLAWRAPHPQIDNNYVENAAAALLRAEAVLARDASVGGRFYFYTVGDRRVSQGEVSEALARRTGRLHLLGSPFQCHCFSSFLHVLAAPLMLLPGRLWGQPAGRACQPKPYFTTGSSSEMGFYDQTFDNGLFCRTFGYSHVFTVEEAVERMAAEEVEAAGAVGAGGLRARAVGQLAGAASLPLSFLGALVLGGSEAAQLLVAAASPATHLLGIATLPAYRLWQPFRGGRAHVALQALGWTFFSLLCCQWLLTWLQAAQPAAVLLDAQAAGHAAVLLDDRFKVRLGLSSQALLGLSLLAFRGQAAAQKAE
mmetsp:Transcript_90119/g.291629  ORF Transcript_90119/g.291629 Transcript_90119/m.291629 type:complete len:512 (+) Transcript_90119:71-1606(+)